MRKIIINADDYGLSKSVNDGIIYTYNNGVITSTTIMANLCSVSEMRRLIEEAPGIGIGVHLNITKGKPLTEFSMVNEGVFFRSQINKGNLILEEVKKEFIAQIEKVLSAGIKITHLDSHHHVHLKENLQELSKELSKEYQVPVRGITSDIALDTSFYNETISITKIQEIILSTTGNIEIMTHPGFVDADLINISIYNVKRAIELDILTSNELKSFFKEHHIKKATY